MTKKRCFSIGRRPFLAGLGTAGASIFVRPLLAEAQTGQTPKRFFMFHYPCGTVAGIPGFGQGAKWFWRPTGSGPMYTASPLLNLFAPVRSSILSIHGLIRGDRQQQVYNDKHTAGMIYMGTGYVTVPSKTAVLPEQDPNSKMITAATPTIDQQLLQKFPEIFRNSLVPGGTPTQYPSIQLAGSPHSMVTATEGAPTCLKILSYADKDKPLAPEARTQNAFNNIFGMAMMPGVVDPTIFARQQAQKRSILDFVISDIQRMQQIVPVSQRGKFDAQLTSIRSLEARIPTTPPTGAGIVKPVLATEPAGAYEPKARTVHANLLDIIKCAFQSDLTRVATFSSGHGNNEDEVERYFSPAPFAFQGDGHGCSHNGKSADAMAAKGEVAALFLKAVADMFINMSKIPDGADTLLDNTLGVVFSECEDGDPHSEWFPLLAAGGKWLGMQTGQHLITPDRYVNDFWIPALSAIGGQPVTTWGDPKYAKGALPGVFA
jgi:hypothetical protein